MYRNCLFVAVIVAIGCSSSEDPTTAKGGSKPAPAAEEKAESFGALQPVDLSEHGLPLTMDLPAGAEFRDPALADLEIVSGQAFQLFIAAGHEDLAAAKEKETGDKSFYDYLGTEIDEPHRLVVRGDKRGDEVYVIFSNLEIDGKPYSVTNLGGAWLPKSKAQLAWVLKSIDSLRSNNSAGAK